MPVSTMKYYMILIKQRDLLYIILYLKNIFKWKNIWKNIFPKLSIPGIPKISYTYLDFNFGEENQLVLRLVTEQILTLHCPC